MSASTRALTYRDAISAALEEEMDLNPVFAYSDGLTVVDARIVLEDA